MSFDDDFDEFGDLESFFNSSFAKRFQGELNKILEQVRNGKIDGTWEIREIKEPNADGYLIRGSFRSGESLDPLEPVKPLRRRPLPEKPFEVPKNAFGETAEPLTDVFEEKDAIKIYVELPAAEENEIQVSVKQGQVDVKTDDFHKLIDIPNGHVDAKGLSSKYRNGVLEITIPKKQLGYDRMGEERMV